MTNQGTPHPDFHARNPVPDPRPRTGENRGMPETVPATTPATTPTGSPAVTLRLIRTEDAPTLAALELHNREHLLSGAPLRDDSWFTVEGQRTAIEAALSQSAAGLAMPMVIVAEQEGEQILGRLSLNGITRGAFQSASLGYWVDAGATGRGIATRALGAAVDLAFGPLGLHRLQAEVAVRNDASLRVLAHHGFREYGLAPRYLRLGGRWTDCRLFQLLAEPDAPGLATEEAESAGSGTPSTAGTPSTSGEPADSVEPADRAEPAGPVEPDDPADPAHPAEPSTPLGPLIRAERPDLSELMALYDAVGWTAYTREPAVLAQAIAGSARVVTAREDGRVVGLARVVGDGATIAYLQDVLVHPEARRHGIGRRLVQAAFAPFDEVRQHVLMTDAEPGQRAFYEALGFTEVHELPHGGRAFARLT